MCSVDNYVRRISRIVEALHWLPNGVVHEFIMAEEYVKACSDSLQKLGYLCSYGSGSLVVSKSNSDSCIAWFFFEPNILTLSFSSAAAPMVVNYSFMFIDGQLNLQDVGVFGLRHLPKLPDIYRDITEDLCTVPKFQRCILEAAFGDHWQDHIELRYEIKSVKTTYRTVKPEKKIRLD